jgi:hypothetical protein
MSLWNVCPLQRCLTTHVERTGESQRILPHAVRQKFETSSSGALVPATENSTRPTSIVITHAGIAVVETFSLMP